MKPEISSKVEFTVNFKLFIVFLYFHSLSALNERGLGESKCLKWAKEGCPEMKYLL